MKLKNHVPSIALAAIFMSATIPAIAAERVYIPLGSENKIITIDPATDTVVGAIEGVTAVHGLAATPNGKLLIAGSYDERPLGAAPGKPASVSEEDHAAHHRSSAKSVASPEHTVSTVSIIQLPGGDVVRRVDVPGAVHHVAVSPDGRFAVVTHPNEDSITSIDLESFSVVATVKTGSVPNYSTFSRDNRRLYVSSAGDDKVAVVETADWKVSRWIPVGKSPEHLVLSADGTMLFVNNVDDGTVSVVSLRSGYKTETFSVGAGLHGIDLSDDGGTLFVAATDDQKVVAMDSDGKVFNSIRTDALPYHVAAVRTFGKVYVSSVDEPKIWVLKQSDLSLTGEIQTGGKGHQMVQVKTE
jgi:YVTN family beta-propeller protein